MTRAERMKILWANPAFRDKVKASRAIDKPRRKWGEAKREKEEKRERRALLRKEKEERKLARKKKQEIYERIEEKTTPLELKQELPEQPEEQTEPITQEVLKQPEEQTEPIKKEKETRTSAPSLGAIMTPCVDCKILWRPEDIDQETGLCPLCKVDI